MITPCSITDEMLTLARIKARQMGQLRNSITKGKGNVYGFIGELVVARYIGGEVRNTRDYDLVKGELKFDAKTKKVTSEPKPNYLCSVADFNTEQKCDAYIFVRVKDDFSRVWILGTLPKEEFYRKAKFFKEGEIDPGGNGKWKFTADCYNIQISKLKDVGDELGKANPASELPQHAQRAVPDSDSRAARSHYANS